MSHDELIPPDSSQPQPPDAVAAFKERYYDQAMQEIIEPLHKAGFTEVQPIGFTTIQKGLTVTESYPNDWVLLGATVHPLIRENIFYGRHKNVARLKSMVGFLPNQGKNLLIFIGHEIPKGYAQQIRQTGVVPRHLLEPAPNFHTCIFVCCTPHTRFYWGDPAYICLLSQWNLPVPGK